MDIAIVIAFLLYKDITKGKGEVPMHKTAFRETLVKELAAAANRLAPSPLHVNVSVSLEPKIMTVQ